jgi:hypothetical protein
MIFSKLKSEIEKLQDFYCKNNEEESKNNINLDKKSQLEKTNDNSEPLIQNPNEQLFNSIKVKKSNTSLLLLKNRNEQENTNSINHKEIETNNVNQIAKLIVNNVVVNSLNEVNGVDIKKNIEHITSIVKKNSLSFEEQIDERVHFELEDESIVFDENTKIKAQYSEIEEFKLFLKENNAFLFYKLWLDIEKIEFYLDQNEKQK